MRYIAQLAVIMVISFLGEVLAHFLPLPIPASIYGMALLFCGLMTGIIPLRAVRETGRFLVEIMPLFFVPAAVGLLDVWETVRIHWAAYAVIIALSTFVVMAASGWTTQAVMRRKGGK